MPAEQPPRPAGPQPPVLSGLRVLDISHQYSGGLCGSLLADLGADVVVVEHPDGSPIRGMLPRKGSDSLWWKVVGRGKRAVTLRLSSPQGRELFLRMARSFDVIVENFRPGTLERWRLGPADLEAAGVSVVLMRISGFGQTGPLSGRPGFGTVAEAMSGFAHLNGEPTRPPAFPSATLADGVAAVFAAFGVTAAMLARERRGGTPSAATEARVDVVDMALFEGLFRLIPTQVVAYDQLGLVPQRPGNKLTSHGVLRNLYRTADARYFVISAIGEGPVGCVLRAIGADGLLAELKAGALRADPESVLDFLDRCDAAIADWAKPLTCAAAVAALDAADAVHQTVYTVAEIVADPQYRAREDLLRVPDDDLGPVLMQGVVPKFPGRRDTVRWAGRPLGADNAEVYTQLLGLTADELDQLRQQHVI